MELYGSSGISQANGYSMASAEAERQIDEGNANIDDNIRNIAIGKKTAKGVVDQNTKQADAVSATEQGADVYGLNKLRKGYKAGKEIIKGQKLKNLTAGLGEGEFSLSELNNTRPADEVEDAGADVDEADEVVEAGGSGEADINAVEDFGRTMASRGTSATAGAVEGASEVAQTASEAVGLGAEGSRLGSAVGGGAELASGLASVGGEAGEAVAKSALKAGLSTTAKTFGGVGAVIGGGLAIADLADGKKKNEWDKWGDYLSVGGSTAELAGLGVASTGAGVPLALGLEVVGGLSSIAGGVLGEIGKFEDKKKKDTSIDTAGAKEKATLEAEKQSTAPAGASSLGAGGGASSSYDSSKLIQASGSF